MAPQIPPGAEGDVAAKLDYLFQRVHPGKSPADIAALVRQVGGPEISGSYVWMLRTGRRTNPSMQVIAGLAAACDVPVAYFFDSDAAEQVEARLELLQSMANAGVRQVAGRAADLSPESLRALTGVIEHFRQLEGLPDAETGEGEGEGDAAAES